MSEADNLLQLFERIERGMREYADYWSLSEAERLAFRQQILYVREKAREAPST